MLTIALVVMVIFLFLRSVSATIIASVAVPLSLVGTFGVMYLAGYSLNNLSMMALTISTGFVVDDAIVMIENISRYIEEREQPMESALKGAEQIGFTILSLTVSLIAVLIPLLFMGDVAGRLFRQFAVTLAVTIILSAFVSLTLTPMMSARLLRYLPPERQGRFYSVSERAFEKIIAFYGRTLRFVLRHQTVTLLIAVATFILTVVLYLVVPKGFFPTQDTGIIQGISQASAVTSFSAMTTQQQALSRVLLADPAVASISSFIGADGINTTLNSGRIQINLKPMEQRKISAAQVIARLEPKLAQVPGIRLYMQPVQDLTVDDRASRTQYQYTLEDPNQTELNAVVHDFVAKLRERPELADVVTDQQLGGLSEFLMIDRASASRFGVTPAAIDNTLYDAFGQRQINTLYTQLNQYHVVLEADPQFQKNPKKLNDIYIQSTSINAAPAVAASNTAGSSSGAGSGAVANPGKRLAQRFDRICTCRAGSCYVAACLLECQRSHALSEHQQDIRSFTSFGCLNKRDGPFDRQHEHANLVQRNDIAERNLASGSRQRGIAVFGDRSADLQRKPDVFLTGSPECRCPLRNAEPGAIDQPPGPVSGRDGIVQPGGSLFARRGDRCD